MMCSINENTSRMTKSHSGKGSGSGMSLGTGVIRNGKRNIRYSVNGVLV
jgi:hypothetical protein